MRHLCPSAEDSVATVTDVKGPWLVTGCQPRGVHLLQTRHS